jgi:hypothetical protein
MPASLPDDRVLVTYSPYGYDWTTSRHVRATHGPKKGRLGKLINLKHEIRMAQPEREYCDDLMFGQFIVALTDVYDAVSRVSFTVGRNCPGTGMKPFN